MIQLLFLGGCQNFTLVGNLSLGGIDDASSGSVVGEDGNPITPEACYLPLPSEAKSDLTRLGYTPANSPALYHWFLTQPAKQLPTCPPTAN